LGKEIVDEYNNIPGVNVKAVSDQLDKNLEFCRDRYGVKNLHHDLPRGAGRFRASVR